MSYVEKVLQPGEQLRYQATIHWVTYLHGAAWLLAALLVWLVTPASWRDGFLMNTLLIILVAVKWSNLFARHSVPFCCWKVRGCEWLIDWGAQGCCLEWCEDSACW